MSGTLINYYQCLFILMLIFIPVRYRCYCMLCMSGNQLTVDDETTSLNLSTPFTARDFLHYDNTHVLFNKLTINLFVKYFNICGSTLIIWDNIFFIKCWVFEVPIWWVYCSKITWMSWRQQLRDLSMKWNAAFTILFVFEWWEREWV